MTVEKVSALEAILREPARLAVAVSGGVDSLTLAVAAARWRDRGVDAFHAVSPAVPPAATLRVRRNAVAENIALHVFDAGEFADPRYLSNPSNRCYFCKHNLYGALSAHPDAAGVVIATGTNVDDLSEFRPGLQAAAEAGVQHPYVAAGMTKADVRALARALALDDLAPLPAAPCLSSRIETGIAISAEELAVIDRVETYLRAALGPGDIRLRLRRDGPSLEVDSALIENLSHAQRRDILEQVESMLPESLLQAGALTMKPYTRGSAFIVETALP
jgi:pyridinium-3,5-biscarboxylic acid mononucleotide sulfurtransferase